MEFDEKEMMEKYFRQLKNEKELELKNNSERLQDFSEYCNQYSVSIQEQDFDYIQKIGIVAHRKNILKEIFPDLPIDKDGLVPWSFIKEIFKYKIEVLKSNGRLYWKPRFRSNGSPIL